MPKTAKAIAMAITVFGLTINRKSFFAGVMSNKNARLSAITKTNA